MTELTAGEILFLASGIEAGMVRAFVGSTGHDLPLPEALAALEGARKSSLTGGIFSKDGRVRFGF